MLMASAARNVTRQQRLTTRAAEEVVGLTDVEPEDARSSIAVGLKFSNAGQWAKAQEYFEKALELPGTGLKRWRDKPPALSTGELTSALYNIACCRSQLGDIENGLIAMSGAVEQGYRDFQQVAALRSDPDLTALRADERFEGFLRRYERKQPEKTGFMGLF
ncbi:hypothetical protein CHLNCDRAFT_135153 [Chlorella variabilis]|uniref:Uncharacterized protein n=1 Tax=Chlorella variabilis TaxID=554065 RepID=E1ZHL4_CHLVA|nr:hypothetical protein CHLNCDRAFT_135153 [Chlorella variabilis]EFN54485.1 hypothetical protein CHLNCDRAFT_135153 [Chlorella variabilis]|eukprot:XP_005846587.1 hypothetical protein CHLNCDRAFT_135153 [Chlorella variabilis]